jgi:hypothetical protein
VVAHRLINVPGPFIDLRPSRLDVDTILKGGLLDAATRRAVVDALENRCLLFATEVKGPIDADGRLSANDLDVALGEFDEQIRTTVKSALLQLNALT